MLASNRHKNRGPRGSSASGSRNHTGRTQLRHHVSKDIRLSHCLRSLLPDVLFDKAPVLKSAESTRKEEWLYHEEAGDSRSARRRCRACKMRTTRNHRRSRRTLRNDKTWEFAPPPPTPRQMAALPIQLLLAALDSNDSLVANRSSAPCNFKDDRRCSEVNSIENRRFYRARAAALQALALKGPAFAPSRRVARFTDGFLRNAAFALSARWRR